MNVLQSWLIVGIPALVALGGLFVGRHQLRAWIGYALLAAVLIFFVLVPRDTISAAAFGLLAVFLVGGGRGTHTDADAPEHHENRKRYTTDPSAP